MYNKAVLSLLKPHGWKKIQVIQQNWPQGGNFTILIEK